MIMVSERFNLQSCNTLLLHLQPQESVFWRDDMRLTPLHPDMLWGQTHKFFIRSNKASDFDFVIRYLGWMLVCNWVFNCVSCFRSMYIKLTQLNCLTNTSFGHRVKNPAGFRYAKRHFHLQNFEWWVIFSFSNPAISCGITDG